jgi:pimeloyl-ACP methyl ester carboxylesterase
VGSTGLEVSQPNVASGIKLRAEDAIRAMFYDQAAADRYLAQGILENSPEDITQFMATLNRLGPPTLNLRSELPGVRAPTLMMWGERDQISPVANAYELARLIPNCKLHIIPNCGHVPQIERPEEAHRIIAEFLKG